VIVAMTLNREQQKELEIQLARLTEDEIKSRLAHGDIWHDEQRRFVERYLEKLEMERMDRFGLISWIAVAAVLVGFAGLLKGEKKKPFRERKRSGL
jgi:hypothetical protein